jgi:hypothetical protein
MKRILGFLLLFISSTAFASPLDYFPADYEASKERFLRNAEKIRKTRPDAEMYAIEVGAERLTTDLFYLPARKHARSLIVITSGNHGPEGYAGGALQALFMEEILPRLPHDEAGILLVHALNPWGFKHHRRGTENNVNLNRNFDLSRELFSTPNEGYEQLAEMLETRGPVRSSTAFPASRLLIEMATKKSVTQQTLTEAIGKGQYRHENGINYGGHDFEPQTLEIIPLLAKIAAPYSAVLNLDLHTGLGKKNVLHLMTKREMNARSQAAMNRLLGGAEDRGRYEITPPEAEGFYEIHGDYANILGRLFPEENRVIIPITAEFGTVGNGLSGKVTTINRLILENQGHRHGFANAHAKKVVERRFLRLFYPQTRVWKESTLSKGRYLLDVVVRRFISQSALRP